MCIRDSVEADGQDYLVAEYKVRAAFGRKAGRVQSFTTGGEAFYFQSHFRSNGTVDVWSDDFEEMVPCEGATEKIDRRRDLVTQRVPAACLGEATDGELSSAAFVFAPRSGKLAVDFTDDFREFSWGSTVVE